MQSAIAWIVANKAIEITVLFILSEGLALIPSVKANSIFQLIVGWVSKEKSAQDAAASQQAAQ